MKYVEYLNNTIPYNNFIQYSNNSNNDNNNCCFTSILHGLKNNNLVSKYMNSFILKQKLCNWLIKNYEKYIPEVNDTIGNLIIETHDLFLNEYKEMYVNNINTKNFDCWGGIPEIIAASYLYNININIYTLCNFNNKLNKIEIINKKKLNRYKLQFKIIQNSNININMLLENNIYNSHYIFLIPTS